MSSLTDPDRRSRPHAPVGPRSRQRLSSASPLHLSVNRDEVRFSRSSTISRDSTLYSPGPSSPRFPTSTATKTIPELEESDSRSETVSSTPLTPDSQPITPASRATAPSRPITPTSRPATPASVEEDASYPPSPQPSHLAVRPVQKGPTLTAPPIKFEPASVAFKGIPLEAALCKSPLETQDSLKIIFNRDVQFERTPGHCFACH